MAAVGLSYRMLERETGKGRPVTNRSGAKTIASGRAAQEVALFLRSSNLTFWPLRARVGIDGATTNLIQGIGGSSHR
jgi:hypothetical protein